MTGADLARLGRTVMHLRPGQAAHRARLRAQQQACAGFPRRGAGSWPARTRRPPWAGRTGSGRWTR